jgi:hypothetical protein
LHALLQYQRESLVRKVAGLDETAARRPLVGSGTSLLWLMKHMAVAEAVWVQQRFAGQDVSIDDDVRTDGALTGRQIPANETVLRSNPRSAAQMSSDIVATSSTNGTTSRAPTSRRSKVFT